MTQRERDHRAGQHNEQLKAFEKRYVGSVYEALRKQTSSLADEVKYYGVAAALRQLTYPAFNMPMTTVLRKMHLTSGLLMANRTYSELNKQPTVRKYRTFGFNERWTNEMIQYFRDHLLDSVNDISETTKRHIQRILEKGIGEGWSVERMVKEINDKEYLRHRAQRIVRTESNRAANYGVKIGSDVYEYQVQKEWIAVNDGRTRHSHRNVDGQLREMEDGFSNGLDYPGDPEGALKEIVNCRCTMAIVPKRDKNGRLIPRDIQTPVTSAGRTRLESQLV